MRLTALPLILFGAILPLHLSAAMDEIEIWPGAVPGEDSFDPSVVADPTPKQDKVLRIPLVTEPTLTLFPAPAHSESASAVLVCPGGGYNILAWDLEGTEVAAWLNSLGLTAAVLKYRVPRRSPAEPHAAPVQDAQRALALMRANAAEWGFSAERVGMLGFSAGGNLVLMTASAGNKRTYPRQDDTDDAVRAPDFLVPIYPAYLGDEKTAGPLDPRLRVTPDFPETFIAVTQDDVLRGLNAAQFYIELQKSGVPAELHIYTKGGHGYGIRPSANPVATWNDRCADWLRAQGWLDGEPKV